MLRADTSWAGFHEHLHFERSFAIGPKALWPLVTDPAQMNRWSEGHITLSSGNRGDEVGAVRQVRFDVFGVPVTLKENIAQARSEELLVYEVTGGGGIRHHRGEVRLLSDGTGTRLKWRVGFTPLIPGTGYLMKALLVPKLERSLDVLQRLAASDVPVS